MSVPSNVIVPDVGSISRSSSRPTVVLPDPDSPTSPSVSPRRTSKLDPGHGLDDGHLPVEEPAPDREVLDQVADLDQRRLAGPHRLRARALAADVRAVTGIRRRARGQPLLGLHRAGRVVVEPAADVMARAVRRAAPGAASVDSGTSCSIAGPAARREAAGRRQVDEVGHVARDDRQLVLDVAHERDARDQAARVRVERLAEQRHGVRLLDDLARVHHGDPVAHLRHDAQVVGDEDDRRARSPRAGRASGRGSAPGSSRPAPSSARRRSAAPARTRAPSRSSRAAPCRPTSRGDRPSSAAPDRGCPTILSSSIDAAAWRPSRSCSDAARAPRRSAQPTSQTGFSDDWGCWKIMLIRLPRILRISSRRDRQQVPAVEHDLAGLDLPGRARRAA